MKLLVVLSLFVVFGATAPSGEIEFLRAIDYDLLETNDKEREAIFNCLLEKTPCGVWQQFRGMWNTLNFRLHLIIKLAMSWLEVETSPWRHLSCSMSSVTSADRLYQRYRPADEVVVKPLTRISFLQRQASFS